MGRYHDYLYDLENKKIIGDYEAAYANCDEVHPSQHELDTPKHHMILAHLLVWAPAPGFWMSVAGMAILSRS